MALFHGAGGDCESKLMLAVAAAFRDAGYLVFRGDLPFRQRRAHGPGPSPARQAEDREGILRAANELRKLAPRVPLYLAGHSYGGRQETMLAAANPEAADALLLLSYPLHPPGQPAKQRVEHFPALRTPALFVHGTKDPFGSLEQMEAALKLVPARVKLIPVEGAGHGLPPSAAASLPGWFSEMLNS